MKETSKELITIPELSEMFGLKKSYIYKMLHEKSLPHYKPFGKKVFFKLNEINEILEVSKVKSNKYETDKLDKQRELLIDFMDKTQSKLGWGWDLWQSEKLADEYLKVNSQ